MHFVGFDAVCTYFYLKTLVRTSLADQPVFLWESRRFGARAMALLFYNAEQSSPPALSLMLYCENQFVQ